MTHVLCTPYDVCYVDPAPQCPMSCALLVTCVMLTLHLSALCPVHSLCPPPPPPPPPLGVL